MKSVIITPQDIDYTNATLYEDLLLRRWSEVTVTNGKFTESSKQGLNCIITYFWAQEILNSGQSVDFSKFPKIALMRGFTKTLQCDVSEHNLHTIFQLGNVSKNSFDEMIWDNVSQNTSEAFFQHLQVEECLETRIYRAATKLSTYLELKELKTSIHPNDYAVKEKQLRDVIREFNDLPCFEAIMSDAYIEIFRNFSKLRNRIRWAKHPNIIPCSVLGHLFDVGCYAYLMSLEINPYDEDTATQYFFMGIFHDIPEAWTGDMPSPIKDSLPGLRKATEDFENIVMEEHVYRHLPPHMVKAIRAVMMEDEENVEYKVFLKKADNLSAYVECWRELDSGSNHYYYKDVIITDYSKRKNLPFASRRLMTSLYRRCHITLRDLFDCYYRRWKKRK